MPLERDRKLKRRSFLHRRSDLRNVIAEGAVRVLSETQQELLVQAIISPGDETAEGTLVAGVAVTWFEIVRMLKRDPGFMYRLDWRKWEEIVAGAYEQAGFDEVTLTPRSGDMGRDVIAVKRGYGSIRIIEQVKAYAPGHKVPANDVRALLGVLTNDSPKASKGIMTTTSYFAPGIERELQAFIPYRLELKDGPALLKWLDGLADDATK